MESAPTPPTRDPCSVGTSDSWAPHRTWERLYVPPKWDLAQSHVHPCTLEDIPGALEAVTLYERNLDGYPPLVRALARRYDVETDNVTVTTGATGAMFLALAALIRPGDKVAVEWPGHDSTAGAVRILGGEVVDMTRDWGRGFAVDPDQLARTMTHDVKAIVLSNPHDPTGTYASPAELLQVEEVAKAVGAKVIVHEALLDTVAGVDTTPAARLSDTFISINGWSKSLVLPGLRLGWVLADPETTGKMRKAREVVNGSGPVPVERMGVVVVGQMDRLLARARGILGPNLDLLTAFVDGRPELEWVRPAGGTVAFPRLSSGADSEGFIHMAYRDFDVGLVPGVLFGHRRNFRLSMGVATATLQARAGRTCGRSPEPTVVPRPKRVLRQA